MASKEAPQDSRTPEDTPKTQERGRTAQPPAKPTEKQPVPHLKPVYTDWAEI